MAPELSLLMIMYLKVETHHHSKTAKTARADNAEVPSYLCEWQVASEKMTRLPAGQEYRDHSGESILSVDAGTGYAALWLPSTKIVPPPPSPSPSPPSELLMSSSSQMTHVNDGAALPGTCE